MPDEVWARDPYGPRDDRGLLDALHNLTQHHLEHCAPYKRIWPNYRRATRTEELPFLHVGLFKLLVLKNEGVVYERTLLSSSTSGTTPSRVRLDATSSARQAASSHSILANFCGPRLRPLLILDSIRSLRRRGEVSARIAAALSLKPLASSVHFILQDEGDPASSTGVEQILRANDDVIVYGFTWMLWRWWTTLPESTRRLFKRVCFVHSGGWKKLEAERIERAEFDRTLLATAEEDSKVVDYYGLVEQVGIIYPLCEFQARHVPVWADVLIRDPHTLVPTADVGQIQLLNTLAYGAPYHSVLTEDVGRLLAGPCPCGRTGPRFELLSRLPRAEIRGCANV